MIKRQIIISSIVLSISILSGCKPDAKRISKPNVSTTQSAVQKSGHQAEKSQARVVKRVNVINNLNMPIPQDASDKERMRIAVEWLDAAQNVAQRSRLPEAQGIAAFIRANGIISKPHQDLLLTIGFSSGITQDNFRIVPIIESDDEHPIARTYAPKGMAGRYSPSIKVLWLRNAPLSTLGRGLLLLHEGAHVLQRKPRYQGEGGWCAAEYDAFGVQSNVLSAIGGKPYSVILLSQANVMLEQYRKSGGAISLPEYDSRYDVIFGKSQSVSDTSLKRSAFGIHAFYTMLNGMSSGPGKSAFVQQNICKMYESIVDDGMKASRGN